MTTIDPPLTWHIDLPLLDRIANENAVDFGSNGWRDAMYESFPVDWQEEIERRSGKDFPEVIRLGVRELRSLEPEPLAEELRRTFAKYGITLTVGDVPPVDPRDLPNADWLELYVTDDVVAGLWRLCEGDDLDAVSLSDTLILSPTDAWDYLDLLPGGSDGIVADACAAYQAGADPSLFFLALQRAFAERDVPIEFAAHPEHGDVIARANSLA